MSKFKVGDKVVLAPGNSGVEYFYALQGKREYYTITNMASASGYWLQLDGVVRGGVDHYPWHWSFFNMYQEPENELPPAPKSVRYHHLGYLRLNSDSYLDVYTGNFASGPCIRLRNKNNIGITIDADTALQLAHDLRRMAMEIKRKEKANAL
ncbi:hypothetical protein vBKpnPBP5_10 [Klebsiella phage vB_KpnP_Bp5]|uniref:Uncharacterized protein n=1 Tax=Klebsiella phage vB_KpnP_Bp5 TaxID=2593329 RepID=A0A6M2YFR3_9CAUD|nr:hypothetical protein vBKpnPBP5_10 [Klebsiella phage vB_KpnP_Bp5]